MKPFRIISCLAAGALLSGCLSKTMTVSSTPPGAILSINDVEMGPTPITTDWHGGGSYRFSLKLKDHSPLAETVKIKYRWYSAPIIDMGPDFMTTRQVKDHKELHFEMPPLKKENPGSGSSKEAVEKAKKEALEMRAEFNARQ